ncbi:urease accessory protein [Aminobacter aminovorans]|jgi:urease accessory protein|uniref:Urease accessory protein UreE n=1 Tax=Aminobacter aminovorans TaxID=83263 RepID=A0A381ILH2_AMIAI|nr:urease accessory protein UreE [Aminobacter aminovorans]TCS21354.1 urease accessory protein [Aminobacter aminovorans]SUY29086.1 urease accessory protein UreE [Aminobacter aminovorans]
MLKLNSIVGLAADQQLSARLHLLDHEGRVEFIMLDTAEIARRRLSARTDRGTLCAIALPRTQRLVDGAVLLLEDKRAIVVRAEPERWLVFKAADAAAGIELGYCAGNMHWPVRFEGDHLYVVGELGSGHVLDRLQHVLDQGAVVFLGEGK